MRKVLSYGSYDLFHDGEYYYWLCVPNGHTGHFFTSIDEAMRWIRKIIKLF